MKITAARSILIATLAGTSFTAALADDPDPFERYERPAPADQYDECLRGLAIKSFAERLTPQQFQERMRSRECPSVRSFTPPEWGMRHHPPTGLFERMIEKAEATRSRWSRIYSQEWRRAEQK
ncbi:MAG: hypothetical protein ACK4MV_20475 [Beijerinckiaceae bacterium]